MIQQDNGTLMDDNLRNDLRDLKSLLLDAVETADRHLSSVNTKPPATDNSFPQTSSLPAQGLGAQATLHRFETHYGQRMAASTGPRFWGYVTGGTTPAALIGDWLVSAYDINLADRDNSIAPHVELEAIAMLRDLFGLPGDFHGVFVSGATTSNLVALATARQWISRQFGLDVASDGLSGLPPIKIMSGAAHSSIHKVMAILGMGRSHLISIDSLADNREAVDVQALRTQLQALDGQPCIVVANAGTVNSTDFDDLSAIAALKSEFNFWLHVDAAFGGFAACSPRYQHLLNGIEQADSITIDAHKWLNVPYDSAMIFTQHPALQISVFQNSAAYLGEINDQPDFLHLTPENSRRFRALPAWFSLMAYGKAGYQEIVERNCDCAFALAEKIDGSPLFELLAPVRLNTVCFTINSTVNEDAAPRTSASITRFLQALRDDGRVFMTPTVYKGMPAIRAALCNWRTELQDVEIVWEALQTVAAHFSTID